YIPGTIIESVNINCNAVVTGGRSFQKYKYWSFQYKAIEKELLHSNDVCATIRKYFVFEDAPLSQEEANYPLSYGLLIYKDIVQVMLELSIFYHPQNVYCIMVDQGAKRKFKDFIRKLPSCFSNIVTNVSSFSLSCNACKR
ncbi:hypothetical protein COOONC_10166, partial [Cooperia oncophora]